MRRAPIFALAAVLHAAVPSWLERVAPVMTPAEKRAYLALRPEARAKFEADFWADKAIGANEYFKRVAYIDAAFGSSRPGSGANTDQGRVYLSLGPPTRVTRLASSRVFVPMEIWYYDTVPGVVNTELRLLFYLKNSMGWPVLYSPTRDTIRALLLPQSSTRSLFGPNDSISESDIRKKLMFYRSAGGTLMSLTVRGGEFGVPAPLCEIGNRDFDVAPDGQRILAVTSVEGGEASPMVVVVNWEGALNGGK